MRQIIYVLGFGLVYRILRSLLSLFSFDVPGSIITGLILVSDMLSAVRSSERYLGDTARAVAYEIVSRIEFRSSLKILFLYSQVQLYSTVFRIDL
jgi:hypothetical protein